MRELSCIQYPPQYHKRIICSRSRSYAPMLRDDNAVSAPRPHALHRGPVTQPQCHVLHVVLHRSHEPSCSRLIDTLVLLEHRLLTDARARDERAARPHTVRRIQSNPSCAALGCGARTGLQPRGRWCVDRRLSCGTDTRHDVSAGCSCCGRRGAVCGGLPSAQHVGGSRAGAILWTATTMDGTPRRQMWSSHHICVHS